MQHLANLLAASLRLQRPTDQKRDNFGQAPSGWQTETECKHCSWKPEVAKSTWPCVPKQLLAYCQSVWLTTADAAA